ncbi:MAG: hypothetical protein HY231_05690 [Acidobacteria bacterium]|nr:hypothetical protein [Acidobacteriota bacterium]
MKWYHYLLAFFAGVFLANFVPHFVNGISGNPFPSPFGKPPGFGNSSPLTNVLWGGANLLFGYTLLRYSKLSVNNKASLAVFFLGIVVMGVVLSQAFSHHL